MSLGMIDVSANTKLWTNMDPIVLYGNKDFVDVFREDESVGRQIVRFNRMERYLLVNSRFELSMDDLFFGVHQYLYQSDATWPAGAVNHLNIDVNDNGKKFRLKAKRRGDVTEIQSDAGRSNFEGDLFQTDH